MVWEDGADMYEVESRVPLPRPFPLTICLNEKNAVIVKTHITHLKRHTHGHLLRIVTKISLPTPPYSVSTESETGEGQTGGGECVLSHGVRKS